MLIPDPVRPYLDIVRWAIAALVASVLFVSGCNHGQDTQAAKSKADVAKAEGVRDRAMAESAENLRAANACGQLLSDISDATDDAAARAQEQRELAEQAARRATQQAEESRRRATAAERELQESKNQPACRQQLELKLCDAIPLL